MLIYPCPMLNGANEFKNKEWCGTSQKCARKTVGMLHQKWWQTCMMKLINTGEEATNHEHIKSQEQLFVSYTVPCMILAPMSVWYTVKTLRHHTVWALVSIKNVDPFLGLRRTPGCSHSLCQFYTMPAFRLSALLFGDFSGAPCLVIFWTQNHPSYPLVN